MKMNLVVCDFCTTIKACGCVVLLFMRLFWLFVFNYMSHPGSEKMKSKPLYVCPGCSNHMYSNNMVNRYNIPINYMVKSYKMTLGSERKITIKQRQNLSLGAASTGTIGGEVGLASFFFILVVLLI
jgi:hypothetical protein